MFWLLEAILALRSHLQAKHKTVYIVTYICAHFITFLYVNSILFITECKRDLVHFTAL
jgi:hypothetical protein